MNDFPISELRVVRVWNYHTLSGTPQRSHGSTDHMMHMSQVSTYVDACIDLFHKQLPHRDGAPRNASPLWEIRVCKVSVKTDTYWWCTPGLGQTKATGAQLNQLDWGERVWAHPDLIREEKEYEEMEARCD